MTPLEERLQEALSAAIDRYTVGNPNSKAIHEAAVDFLPGGNTRTVLHTDPFPLCVKSGEGYQVTTQDGLKLVNLTGEFTACLFGHSHPVIKEAILDVVANVGLNVSATTVQEQSHARETCQRFGLERVRFTNSGTEANLQALAAARHYTKKRKIVVFGGAYHGSVLGFPGGKPAANNVDLPDWIVTRYNDLESTASAIRSEGVAAVLVEGIQGGGCIVGTPEFLRCIQETASEAGVMFILDEVMMSRHSATGFAGMRGLKPDLKTFGKWLGGGVAFGAFGGRKDLMTAFDPRQPGSLPHSGTFNNNTMAMHLGHAGLTKIYKPQVADEFTDQGQQLIARLNEVTKGTKLCFTGCGSTFNSHFPSDGSREINNADVQEVQELKDLFWFEMVDKGFYPTRRGLIALILDTPKEVLDDFVKCVQAFITTYKELVAV
ncbi:hypothetical protein HIM_08463 [Hirsutella minnesotensis 3608]|uniref:Glutamate-1-semialdehyde 2,1-aminomutase n=1 Tax=Hirsutella minnesotensis 3608 TaxID=1043627 RepID=A0A0F7ZSZ0_9HYPO|nr:hypothetical protein HIM_08463 [Hirsutella minnesotensis 3608]